MTPTTPNNTDGLREAVGEMVSRWFGEPVLAVEDEIMALYHKTLQADMEAIIGEDEALKPLNEWLAKTRKHGGTQEEYWKLYDIVNSNNNLRAEQRAALTRRLEKR